MALTKHTVKENTIVQDRGNFASNRFSIITVEQVRHSSYITHVFLEDEEVLGAERTEIGNFLLKQNLLEEVTDA